MDSVQISQLGKVVGGKLRLGEFARKPVEDGKFTSVFRMTRKTIPLGDGVELAPDMPAANNAVWLNVTAEAAKRHGWPHPANQPKHTPRDLERLRGMIGNEAYGEGEQAEAARVLAEIERG